MEKKDTKFKSGAEWTGNASGRPKGSISIKDKIRKHLENNPEKLEELVKFYMENEQPVMRKLLWEMLDGKPEQTVDMELIVPKPILDVPKDSSDNKDITIEQED
ncbi:hypothetical protein HOB87_13275 [Candidatus Woesearchaeota archaeon]|jgi:hypothetical protein|nr:hypothetical protein [Candidatus Woesearchaeota archaeon]